MNEPVGTEKDAWKNRPARLGMIYRPGKLEEGERFKMRDGAVYVKNHRGDIVRTDKFRGTKKQRIAARKAAKEKSAA